jgi:twinkle protein
VSLEAEEIENAQRSWDLTRDAPLVGVSPQELRERAVRLWEAGLPAGDSTGWPSVDRHYTVVPGQLTILTGWPGSGKSEWLDALLLNLARGGWRFAIFSPENQPVELHLAKFLEKFHGKPFGRGPTERMTIDEMREGLTEMDEWFSFVVPSVSAGERQTFGVGEILDACEGHFRLSGIWRSKEMKKGLVIDPWNELEHLRPPQLSETEYISQALSTIRGWARKNCVHVWIVAHPQKLRRDDGGKLPVPRPDSISGSQHWWNKADNAITIWRSLDDPSNQDVEVHVQKIRFKHVGRPGLVDLLYDRITGRYHAKPPTLRRVGHDA